MALWTRTDRDLLSLALPTFATLVSEPLLVMADTAFIGHVGAVPLAGLGLGGNVLGVITGLCVFLAYSTTSVVAHRLGAGRDRAAYEAGRDGMALGGTLGVVLAALLAWLAPTVVGWYGPAPDVAAAAVTYLRIVAAGLPFQLVVLASTGLLRGLQDTRTPMAVAIGVNVTNIGLDALLINGLGLGIAGSATATAAAQGLSCIVLVAVIVRRCRGLGLGLRPSPRGMGAAASAGGWLVLRTATLWFSLTATTVVATGLGSLTLAAHQVTNSLYSFLTFALDSLAIACQALIGHRLGAGGTAGARTVMARALGWGCVQAAVLGLVLVAVRPWLARLFTSDAAVQRLVMHSFVVLAASMPLAALVFVLDGVLIGAGDTRYLALAGLFVAACHLPMLAAVAHWCTGGPAGLVWLWTAYAGFLAARALTLTLRARTGRWSAPEDRVLAGVEDVEDALHRPGRLEPVVLVEARIPVGPVQAPQSGGPGTAEPRDGRGDLVALAAPGRPRLAGRDVPVGDLGPDAHPTAERGRDPVVAPALDPSGIGFGRWHATRPMRD